MHEQKESHKSAAMMPSYASLWALQRAAEIARSAEGKCAPHPRYGVLLLDSELHYVLAQAYQHGEGGTRPEVLACDEANSAASKGTAFLCLEPPAGGAAGGDEAVRALVHAGVHSCIIGILHPVPEFRGRAEQCIRACGIDVTVAERDWSAAYHSESQRHVQSVVWLCRKVNEALLHRQALGVPMSVHKFAMTLDGKIAAKTGHSAWVSSSEARERVQLERERSDAIIVGGQTLRSDNPRLTARRELQGHAPLRIVLTRSLNVPEDANLWDTSVARTLVATERGANKPMQKFLASKGVEVIELNFVSPRALVEYCCERGFLQLLWECGGTLSAQAIREGVLHQSQAFIAPKIVGGSSDCPSPVGDLGFVEMTQALPLVEAEWNPIGEDMLVTGYLPASGGLDAVAAKALERRSTRPPQGELHFYKAWAAYGALSNFSAHPIVAEDGSHWQTSEHLYQALKFEWRDPAGQESKEMIQKAYAPDVAARLGRTRERQNNTGLRHQWKDIKVDAMRYALQLKFAQNAGPRRLLLATGNLLIKEVCPHDYLWGTGKDGSGMNLLGRLLMELRSKLRSNIVDHAQDGSLANADICCGESMPQNIAAGLH